MKMFQVCPRLIYDRSSWRRCCIGYLYLFRTSSIIIQSNDVATEWRLPCRTPDTYYTHLSTELRGGMLTVVDKDISVDEDPHSPQQAAFSRWWKWWVVDCWRLPPSCGKESRNRRRRARAHGPHMWLASQTSAGDLLPITESPRTTDLSWQPPLQRYWRTFLCSLPAFSSSLIWREVLCDYFFSSPENTGHCRWITQCFGSDRRLWTRESNYSDHTLEVTIVEDTV